MSRLANIGFRAKLLGAFGVVLVILVLLSSIAYRTTVMNQEATDAVTHTLQVINLADETLANVLDMETSYRGFLLSGDEAMLQSYRTANDEIDDNLAELHELTVDNPPQSERWQSVELQVLDWRTNVAAPGIRLRREVTAGRGTIDDVTRWVVSGEGQRRTSGIRATIQQAVGVEQGLLEQRQDEATSRRLVLETMLIVGSIAAIALGLILATLLSADLTGPIRRLASTAQEIAGGQLDRRIGLRRGDEIGVAADAVDRMTERLAANIRESEAILDTVVEGIVGIDSAGRITFANQAALRLLGQPASALEGQPISRWLAMTDLTPSASVADGSNGEHRPLGEGRGEGSEAAACTERPSLVTVLERGAVQRGDGELARANRDAPVPVEFACAPIQGGNRVVGAVLTFRDVSERLAAQRVLEERNRDLARSNADLEQFAYVASHDLQEPLRAVVSYLQLLERRYVEQLDERGHRYIGHAVEGGRRMQNLINDLLAYSRVGRREISPVPVDLEAILKRTLSNLSVALEESGAVVTHDPLPTVVADPGQFAQLFQNLIGNAVKFRSEAPPTVHISATRQDGADAWLFAVRDNGIGIAPDYRERVFLLFQRLHGRDEYPGTGIGLAICKKIVERHGGTLWVDETPGGGSTFHFTIPDAEGDAT